jgi:hypothetical protein
MPENQEKPENVEKMPHFEDRLDAFSEYLASLAPQNIEKIGILTRLIARNIFQSTVLGLWQNYCVGNFEQNDRDEAQYQLLFHKHDPVEHPVNSLLEILTLMATGTTDGDLKKVASDGELNFYPAGFWQLVEVKKVLTDQCLIVLNDMLGAICAQMYSLPDDWEDEIHPEGLFISQDAQAKVLAQSIIDSYARYEEALKGNEDAVKELLEQADVEGVSPDTAPDADSTQGASETSEKAPDEPESPDPSTDSKA